LFDNLTKRSPNPFFVNFSHSSFFFRECPSFGYRWNCWIGLMRRFLNLMKMERLIARTSLRFQFFFYFVSLIQRLKVLWNLFINSPVNNYLRLLWCFASQSYLSFVFFCLEIPPFFSIIFLDLRSRLG